MVTAQTIRQKRIVIGIWTVFAIGCVSGELEAVEQRPRRARVRTWTDSTGDFSVKASFVAFENDTVSLRQADGTEIEVAFDHLSASDQKRAQYEARRQTAAQPRTAEAAAAPRVAAAPGRRLYGIRWQDSPASACQTAAEAGGQPVMWFRVLGDLTGFM